MAFGVLYCVFWLLHIGTKLKSDVFLKPDQNSPLFRQRAIQQSGYILLPCPHSKRLECQPRQEFIKKKKKKK